MRRQHLALAPDNLDRLRNLSASLDKVGDLVLQAGNLAEARKAFEEEMEIDRGIYQRDAAIRVSGQNFAFSLARIADMQRRERNLEGSRKTYDDIFPIHRKLVMDFPDAAAILVTYQLHLTAFGDLLVQIGDREAAIAIYRERIEICRQHLTRPWKCGSVAEPVGRLDKAGNQLLQARDVAGAGKLFAEVGDRPRPLPPA